MSSDAVAYALPIVNGGPPPGSSTGPSDEADASAGSFGTTLAHAIDGPADDGKDGENAGPKNTGSKNTGSKNTGPTNTGPKNAKSKNSEDAPADWGANPTVPGDAPAATPIGGAPVPGDAAQAIQAAQPAQAPVSADAQVVAAATPDATAVAAATTTTTTTTTTVAAAVGPVADPSLPTVPEQSVPGQPVRALPDLAPATAQAAPGGAGAGAFAVPAAAAGPDAAAADPTAATTAAVTAAALTPLPSATATATPAPAKDGVVLSAAPNSAPAAIPANGSSSSGQSAGSGTGLPAARQGHVDSARVTARESAVPNGSAAPTSPTDSASPIQASAPASPASAPAPTLPTPASVVVSSRLEHIAAVANAVLQTGARTGITRARIDLRPVELGHVEIRMRFGADGVHATLTAASADAVQALGSAGGDLKRALEAHGFTVLSLDIGHGAKEDQRKPGSDPEQQATRATGGIDAVEDDDESTIEIESARVPAAGSSVDVLA
ncbi:MAG TPA: flagellar hook-length control protein FliK [Gaiellaceae bacterium]